MSLNIINVTGILSKPDYVPSGQADRRGKSFNFPRFSARCQIADSTIDHDGKRIPLTGQDFWVDISCPTSGGVVDERRVKAFIDRVARGDQYFMMVNGTISQWGNPPKYSVKVSFGDLHLDSKPYHTTNKVILSGAVIHQDEHQIVIEERYNTKDGWKSRNVPIYIPVSNLPSMKDRVALVYGRLAAKDMTGNRSIYVIAEEVY